MTELHRFLFCSSHSGHGEWLSDALRQAGIVMQEAGQAARLEQRIADLAPEVVLLDFSGESGGDADPAEGGDDGTGGIAHAARLARALARTAPGVPLIAVGTRHQPDGAIAALRAGVREFIDMSGNPLEALDAVRRVLQHADAAPADAVHPGRPGRFVVLLGARPGVGTSTLAAHLGCLLQAHHAERDAPADKSKAAPHAGKEPRVALLDLGLPVGDGLLYLNTQSNFHFADAVLNLRRLDETLVHTAMARHAGGLVVLPLPQDLGAMRSVAHADALALTDRLRDYFDTVIADLGGFSNAAFVASLAAAADEVWLVTTQHVGAVVSLAALLKDLDDRGVDRHRLRVVVNRYDPRYGMDAEQIAARFELPLAATLPDRPLAVQPAASQGKLVFDTARHDPYARALQPLMMRLAQPDAAAAPVRGGPAAWLKRFTGRH